MTQQSFPPAGWQALPPPNLPAGPHPQHRRRILALVAAVLLALGGASIAARVALGSHSSSAVSPQTLQTVTQPSSVTSGQTIDARAIAAQVSPAVVDINTVVATLGQSGEAAGTGMVLTSSGLC